MMWWQEVLFSAAAVYATVVGLWAVYMITLVEDHFDV